MCGQVQKKQDYYLMCDTPIEAQRMSFQTLIVKATHIFQDAENIQYLTLERFYFLCYNKCIIN